MNCHVVADPVVSAATPWRTHRSLLPRCGKSAYLWFVQLLCRGCFSLDTQAFAFVRAVTWWCIALGPLPRGGRAFYVFSFAVRNSIVCCGMEKHNQALIEAS